MPKTAEVLTPAQVAPDLGEVYWIWKDAEAEKERLRKQFFDAVTASQTKLAQKTVVVDDRLISADEPADAADQYVEQYNPGWRLVKQSGDDPTHFLIEEDPALKPGQEVVLVEGTDDDSGVWDRKGVWHPGYVVTKTIASGSLLVDTERMEEWEPEMYDKLTEFQGFPNINYNDDPSLLERLVDLDWPRIVRSNLSEEEVEMIKPFTYEGAKQVKLNVRYAKDDETPTT